jgi:thiol-disulfide isomerase/thioredoxin
MSTAFSSRLMYSGAAMLAFLAFPLAGFVMLADAAPAAPDCTWSLQGAKQTSDTQQYHGKVLYVDFWASWCAPCLLSFPFMNELQSAFRGQGLQVMGVNMDQKPDDVQRFLGEHPARFSVATGANAQCAKNFGVAAMPSSYLIDRNGTIRFVHRGFRQGDADQLRTQVEQLLAEKPVTQ